MATVIVEVFRPMPVIAETETHNVVRRETKNIVMNRKDEQVAIEMQVSTECTIDDAVEARGDASGVLPEDVVEAFEDAAAEVLEDVAEAHGDAHL